MKISELLFEYNEQRLINDFGNKLLMKVKSDITAPKTDNPEVIIKDIAKEDPTPNKELTFWLVNNYANTKKTPTGEYGHTTTQLINRYEDIASRAIPNLLKFKVLARKPNLVPPLPTKDINQIQGLLALEDIVEKYEEKKTVSNKELMEKQEASFYKTKEAELIYNDANIKVVVPKTKAASIFFGKGTRWCTAAAKNNVFAAYNKQGPLYVVIIKGTQKKYQFHYKSDQFMNETDKSINPNKLADKYPILWRIFGPIAEKEKSLMLNPHPSESMQKAAVKQNGLAIQYIKNPSESIQMASVQQNGWAIQFIKNPSESIQMAAVQQNEWAIQFIKNPSESIQMASVQQDGDAIQYIKNPSESMQKAAVRKNGRAIQFIKNPSESIQMAAVQQNGWAIDYIKNPSEAIQLAAVQQNGWAIEYIKNPSESIQMAAVQQNGLAIQFIKNPSESIQMAAVKQNGLAIQYIKNPSESIQMASVQQNGLAIYHIKNPSESIQMAAVKQNRLAIQYIKNPSESVQKLAKKKRIR